MRPIAMNRLLHPFPLFSLNGCLGKDIPEVILESHLTWHIRTVCHPLESRAEPTARSATIHTRACFLICHTW